MAKAAHKSSTKGTKKVVETEETAFTPNAGGAPPTEENAAKDLENTRGDAPKWVVAEGQSFRDKHHFSKIYGAGENVSHFDQKRIDDLVSKGLVTKASKK